MLENDITMQINATNQKIQNQKKDEVVPHSFDLKRKRLAAFPSPMVVDDSDGLKDQQNNSKASSGSRAHES